MVGIMYLIKLQIQRQFLAFIIIDGNVIVLYKMTCNTGLAFVLAMI